MKKIPILCALLCFCIYAYSQQTTGCMNRAPEFPQLLTPEAASFNKYVEHPASAYNGTPEINVPLYTLQDGNISLPINLRYNASGIKVNEEAGFVGLGWNLNMGGMIIMNKVGSYDKMDSNYSYAAQLLKLTDNVFKYNQVAYTQAMNATFTTDYFWNLTNELGKFNPDVYSYSYPGGGGKFIFDYRDKSIHILQREENIRIEEVGLKDFRITLPNGIIHRFTEMGGVSESSSSFIESVTYLLTETEYPDGQKVTYTYSKCQTKQYAPYAYFQSGYKLTGSMAGSNYKADDNYSTYSNSEPCLSSITTPHYTVTFTSTDRTDISGGKKLTEVKIVPKALPASSGKVFHFDYSYFDSGDFAHTWNYSSSSAIASKQRLKLDAVYELAGSVQTNRHEFFYDGTPPHKYSYATDYWGYYNGQKANAALLPDLKKCAFSRHLYLGEEYKNLIDIYDKYHFTGYADRSYSFNDCKAGMLAGIKYPTGGYVQYAYEPNSFMEEEILPEGQKSYTVTDMNDVYYVNTAEFAPNDDVTVHITARVSKGIDSWEHFRLAGDTKITIMRYTPGSPNGTAVYSVNFSNDCYNAQMSTPNEQYINRTATVDLKSKAPDGSAYRYVLTVDIPDALGNQNGASTLHSSASCTISYLDASYKVWKEIQGCGVRIKEVASYAKKGDTTPLFLTSYEYQDPETRQCSGILHEIISFIKLYPAVLYLFKDSQGNRLLEHTNVLEVVNGNTISNPYGNCGGVGYSYVKESRRNGTQDLGYTLYRYSNKKPEYAFHSVRLDDPANGKLLEKQVVDASGKIVAQDTYEYNFTTALRYYGANFLDKLNLMPEIYPSHGTYYPLNPHEVKDFYEGRVYIIQHELKAYDVTLKRKHTYSNNVGIEELYEYNAGTLQLKNRKFCPDSREALTYTYSYPNDFNWEPYISMTAKNRISVPVEEKILKDGKLTESKLTEYSSFSMAGIMPAKVHFSNINGALTDHSTFTSAGADKSVYPYANTLYGNYGKGGTVGYMEHNGMKTVFLWGYNSLYPVAKIESATYAEVESWLSAATISNLATSTAPDAMLNSIRNTLSGKNVLVTTYTYQPLVGMTSMTAPNGEKTTYEYDAFGRLTFVKETNGKVVKQSDYHYNN